MLSKKNRIGNRVVIAKLFAKGKLHKDRFLVFKYEPSPEDTSRFAVVVGKKIYKKAVKRNRLRRQIFEALRLHMNLLENNFNIIVVARPSISDSRINFQDINKSINTFINTIN